MAFDGITIANIVKELNDTLTGGRIYKIAQPEADELILTVKNHSTQYRLLISVDASLPLIYLTDNNKQSPKTAPNFCMVLRKHAGNAKIISISQPGLERILRFELEHLDEMGDLCRKTLVVEIMGKHSNIIFTNADNVIIDSIKHISQMVSSVREVLPGKEYFIPRTQDKKNPLEVGKKEFEESVFSNSQSAFKSIYSSMTGISPVIAREICYESNVNEEKNTDNLEITEKDALYKTFQNIMTHIKTGTFQPETVSDKNGPLEYASLPLEIYNDKEKKHYNSISQLLEQYYAEKNMVARIRQKSVDLRKIVQTALDRNLKKYDLQLHQMEDTEKKEKYKVYGELINAYGYGIKPGEKSMEVLNYYTNEMLTIPLDPLLPTLENAKKYFDKYGKLKRTFEALSILTKETKDEIDHLESISTSLEIALMEEDLVQIKEELVESGYIRRKPGKREKITSKPFHFISSDGFHMYVGKNNFQNEELTFEFATGNDWWFHAKGIPGSHVIVKTNQKEVPDQTFEEAARLAAHYSKGRGQEKIEIDYTEKKNVKKPGGSKPGFVIYYTNYSLMIDTDITGITKVV